MNERIKSMLHERTDISEKPDKTIENDLTALRDKGPKIGEFEAAFKDQMELYPSLPRKTRNGRGSGGRTDSVYRQE